MVGNFKQHSIGHALILNHKAKSAQTAQITDFPGAITLFGPELIEEVDRSCRCGTSQECTVNDVSVLFPRTLWECQGIRPSGVALDMLSSVDR